MAPTSTMNTNLCLLGTFGVLVAGYAALFCGDPQAQGPAALVGPEPHASSAAAGRPPFSGLRAPHMAAPRAQLDSEGEAARAVVAALAATERAFTNVDAARAETAAVEPVVRIARGGRHAQVARAFGWPADGWQARALEGWLDARTAALATWTATRDNAAFDAASAALAEELIVTFGRPTAERLAPRLGLRRTDPSTGALLAVDLDGEPLHAASDIK